MKSREFLVIIGLAIFLGIGAGVQYILGTATDGVEEVEELGNLELKQLTPNVYSLTGDVGIGDCERIIPLLPTTAPFTLILESPGGSLGDGICLAANLKIRNVITVIRDTPMINDDGVEVYTPGINTGPGRELTEKRGTPIVMCASACSLLFLAGDERVLIGNVWLGIHAPRSAGGPVDPAALEAGAYSTANRLLQFLEFQLDVKSADLRRLFISVPAATMYYVNPKDFASQPYLSAIATHYYNFFGVTFIDPRASIYAAVSQQAAEIERMNRQRGVQ